MGEILPKPLAIPVILANQDLLDELFDDVRPHNLRRRKGMAFMTVFRADSQHCLFDLMRRAWMRVTSTVEWRRVVVRKTRTSTSVMIISPPVCERGGLAAPTCLT